MVPTPRPLLVAWLLAALAAVAVLQLHLLPALLGGLLVYTLVHGIAPWLERHVSGPRARLAALLLIAVVVSVGIAAGVIGALSFFRSDAGSIASLLARMAEILDDARASLPGWADQLLPDGVDAIKATLADALREHAAELRTVGKEATLAFVHLLIGMVVGAMLSVESLAMADLRPLALALAERARRLSEAFRSVVFAQVKIAAANTLLTGMYLGVALPLFDIHLPLIKTLLAVTFFAGLLPVVGNLVSNGVIVIVSLAYSPLVAVASLVVLVVIHKLEYFLNARIVGSQINARAWELLIAMLAMEAVFGLPGLVVAPIYYAWLKRELGEQGLV